MARSEARLILPTLCPLMCDSSNTFFSIFWKVFAYFRIYCFWPPTWPNYENTIASVLRGSVHCFQHPGLFNRRLCTAMHSSWPTWNVFLLAWTHHCWKRLAEFTVTKRPKRQAANKSAWTRVHEALSAMFARHAINVLLLVMHTTSTAPVPTWLEQHAMLWTLKTARLLRAGEETSPPRFCALHDTCVEVNFAAGICTNMQNKDIPSLHKDIPSLHMHTPYYLCI